MSEHVKLTHEPNDRCHEGVCLICELFTCEVCGCSEGELPTECPGIKLDANTRAQIYAATLDYIGGVWTHTASPHSPGSHRQRTEGLS